MLNLFQQPNFLARDSEIFQNDEIKTKKDATYKIKITSFLLPRPI